MSTRKHLIDKPNYSRIPFDALEEVAKVLAFGAEKYGERDWEKGVLFSERFSSMLRHQKLFFQDGKIYDIESGLRHTAHIACNALIILACELRELKGVDDRPKLPRGVGLEAFKKFMADDDDTGDETPEAMCESIQDILTAEPEDQKENDGAQNKSMTSAEAFQLAAAEAGCSIEEFAGFMNHTNKKELAELLEAYKQEDHEDKNKSDDKAVYEAFKELHSEAARKGVTEASLIAQIMKSDSKVEKKEQRMAELETFCKEVRRLVRLNPILSSFPSLIYKGTEGEEDLTEPEELTKDEVRCIQNCD